MTPTFMTSPGKHRGTRLRRHRTAGDDIYPTAVTQTGDDYWGIDYSKYVPVLLQELKALRARVAALEGGGLISGKPA